MNDNTQHIIKGLQIQLEQEISKRKQAEELFKETEARYQAFFDQALDGIMIMPLDGEYVIVNNAFAKMHGYDSPHELKHIRLQDFDTPESAQLAPERLRRLMAGEAMNFDVEHYRKDGQKMPLNVSCNILNFGGKQYFCGVHRDITKHIQTDEALGKSEQRLRMALNAASMVTWEWDISAGTIRYSANTPELSRGEAIEPYCSIEGLIQEVHPDDRAALTRAIQRTISEGVPYECEYRVKMLDGVYRWISGKGDVVEQIDDKPVRAMGFSQDITEHKEAAMALRESEEKYRLITETSVDVIGQTDIDGFFTYISASTKDTSGFEPEEVIGTHFTKYVPEERQPIVMEMFNKVLSGDGIKSFEIPLFKKDGTLFDAEVIITPIIIGDKIIRIQGVIRDVSEKIKSQNALRESEEKYRLIFDSSPLGIFHYNINGVITECNLKTCEIAGAEREKIVGFNLIKGLKEEEFLNSILDSLKGNSSILEGKYRSITGGRETYLRAYYVPVIAHDEIMGGICVSEDISERIRAEKKLRESHEKLRQLTKYLQSARENERASIARELHDELGQVLTAINMEAVWVAGKIPDGLTTIKSNVESISKHVMDAIGSVKRIISEIRPTLLTDMGLSSAIVWQAEEYQKRTGIMFNLTIDPEEFEVPEDLGLAIFRIFQEAITNIIRHSKATLVKIRLEKNDNGICLEVKDNGIGINDENLSKNESFGILGMRERVATFGGTIELKGKSGKGTTLKAEFPI
jgi:PAS domain S-box-containing protein